MKHLSQKQKQWFKQNCIDYYNNNVERYVYTYKKDYLGYPGNQKRFEIIRSLVKKHAPKKVLYIGCGACMPMVMLMKEFDCIIHGIDFSKKMIDRGKTILQENGFSSDLIHEGDIEHAETLPDDEYDFAIAAGVFTHFPDDNIAFKNIHSKLRNGGVLVVEFRNELFSFFSYNRFSYDFIVNQLIFSQDLPVALKSNVNAFFKKAFDLPSDGDIDYQSTHISNGVIKKFHNPITIASVLKQAGFVFNSNYFYHFHALPIRFEQFDSKTYSNLSVKCEDPTDWKGYFMASAFVSEGIKGTYVF